MFVSIEKSLRQHDLDQVIRVERGSLLSVPHRGTPRSVVEMVIKLVGCFVNYRKNKWRDIISPHAMLSHAALPFFFHFEFAGAGARFEREEVCQ